MGPARPAADLLHDARSRERAGCVPEAADCYLSAIEAAEKSGERSVLCEALRRLAILRHQQDQFEKARELCQRSYDVAREIGSDILAGEALNTMGAQDLMRGSLEDARRNFMRALEVAGDSREVRARADQNLGILANIQGDLDDALGFYAGSLHAWREAGNEHGCAIAYCNMGMVSADR